MAAADDYKCRVGMLAAAAVLRMLTARCQRPTSRAVSPLDPSRSPPLPAGPLGTSSRTACREGCAAAGEAAPCGVWCAVLAVVAG